MTGISIWEIAIVVLAVIVFVRPEDMPKFFRKAGHLYAQVQHYIRQVRSYTQEQFEQVTRLEMEQQNPPQPPPAEKPAAAAWTREPVADETLPPDDEPEPESAPPEGAPVPRSSNPQRD